jgi:hypothetical protein
MSDVSAGGARLTLQTPDKLPDQFLLLLSRDGQLLRRCRLVWQSENTAGVRFARDGSDK